MGYVVIVVGLAGLGYFGGSFGSELVWLLLVMLAGNQVKYFPCPKVPVDERWLSKGKTYDAYLAGPLFAGMAAVLLSVLWPFLAMWFGIHTYAQAWLLGALVGLGVVIGDQVNSFIKQRVNRTKAFIGDRFNWVLGGGIVALVCLRHVTLEHFAALLVLGTVVHYIGNKNSFKFGWRETAY